MTNSLSQRLRRHADQADEFSASLSEAVRRIKTTLGEAPSSLPGCSDHSDIMREAADELDRLSSTLDSCAAGRI